MDSFSENALPQARLKVAGQDEVHWAGKNLFKQLLQTHVIVKGISLELDQEIQVARGCIFAARSRAEQA